MKTNKHTPGPWHATETGVFGETLNGHGNFYIAALPFPGEPPTEREAANLRLIAAAPELLDALEWAAIALKDVPDSGGINRAYILSQARAAIQKATKGGAA